MSLNLLLDIVIIILLIPTIMYAVSLNRRLDTLRKSRNDLGRLIEAFNEATMRAEAGVPKLRQAAEGAGRQLHAQVEKAQNLRDDLAFMIERADSMANRLEDVVREARNESKPSSIGSSNNKRDKKDALSKDFSMEDLRTDNISDIDDEKSQAEQELLKALRSVR